MFQIIQKEFYIIQGDIVQMVESVSLLYLEVYSTSHHNSERVLIFPGFVMIKTAHVHFYNN